MVESEVDFRVLQSNDLTNLSTQLISKAPVLNTVFPEINVGLLFFRKLANRGRLF